MNIRQSLINRYNQADSLIMISPFPPKGVTYGKGIGGLASYAKNTMMSLAKRLKNTNRKVIILTHKEHGQETYYQENNMLVVRCFDRDTFRLYSQLVTTLRHFDRVKQVSIQFEFAAYGGFIVASLFPILLSALRAEGKKISVVLHQVVDDLSSLSGHIGLAKGSVGLMIFNQLLKMYYRILGWTSHTLITLEETLAQRLSTIVSEQDKGEIISIAHGVDTTLKPLAKKAARKKVAISNDEIVLISFGYLTWYKGTDLLIKALPAIQKAAGKRKVRLILAGGPSETQSEKTHYQKFINKVTSLAVANPAVTITGFVKDEDISAYYSAADLVILPYRSYMSSSGPLSLAYTYGKPFLLSKPLTTVLQAPDYQQALADLRLSIDDVTAQLNASSLAKKIAKSIEPRQLGALTKLSKTMRARRAYDQQANQLEYALFANQNKKTDRNFSKTTITKWYSRIALPMLAVISSYILK